MSVYWVIFVRCRIWTPRLHPKRWRSWGWWRRRLYGLRRWQPSSRPLYPASSACSTAAATAAHAAALDALPPISAHLSKPKRVLASGTANWYLDYFDAGVFAHSLQRRSWSRRWDTPSLYGIQQDRASMGGSPQISSLTFSSLGCLVVKLLRGAGATCGAAQALRAAQERALACKANSWCPANIITQNCCLYAKLLILRRNKRITQTHIIQQNNEITQTQEYYTQIA